MFNIWFAVVKEKDLARLDLICGLYEHKQHLQTEIRIQMLIMINIILIKSEM